MKILLTGASGFFGRIIFKVLDQNSITTLSRSNANINFDLGNGVPVLPLVDVVIHAAGKAHMIPLTDDEGQDFFKVNVDGTRNLLLGLEQLPTLPKSFVFISSVSVYGRENGHLIQENSPLLATDPYGLSKIQTESLVCEWCEKNNIKCAILRLPLIIGPNAPGNLNAMINGIKKGLYFNINRGKTRKSMVVAIDVARIIPKAAQLGGTFNLTDRHHPSFFELSRIISSKLGKRQPMSIPTFFAKILAKFGDVIGPKSPINSYKLLKITSDLTFDDSKAISELDWQPTPVLEYYKTLLYINK